MNTFIQQGGVKLIKLQKIQLWCYRRFLFQINIVLLHFLLITLFIRESWKNMFRWTAQLLINDTCAPNHIRMISDGSCNCKECSMMPIFSLANTGENKFW